MVSSVSVSDQKRVAEQLLNCRGDNLVGATRIAAFEDEQDGVSVRMYPDRYCSMDPCVSLFIEKSEGGFFPDLEGALVRIRNEAAVIFSEPAGMNQIKISGKVFAEGRIESGKVVFNNLSVPEFFVEIVPPEMASAA